jgi:hypothetical protein
MACFPIWRRVFLGGVENNESLPGCQCRFTEWFEKNQIELKRTHADRREQNEKGHRLRNFDGP